MPAISVMGRVRSASRIPFSKSKPALQTLTQAISSANNLLLTLIVAFIDPVNGLGRFNLGFTIYISALGLARAMVVEPMLVGQVSKSYAGAQKIVLVLGLVAGSSVAAVGYSTGDYVLVTIAVSLPVLLFLDLVRYKHFRTGRPEITLVMDAIWISAVALLWVIPPGSVERVILFWVLGGGCALIVGLAWDGLVRWQGEDLKSFFNLAKGISVPSALESLIFQFVWQIPFAVILGLISLTVAGEYRAAVTLMAPLGVVVASWTLSSYARLRAVESSSKRVYGIAAKIGMVSCAYLLICLLLREQLNSLLFHSADAVSLWVLLITGLQIPVLAFGSQLAVWFKIQRGVKNVLLARSIASLGLMTVLGVGAYLGAPLILIASLPTGMLVHILAMVFLRFRLLRQLSELTTPGTSSVVSDRRRKLE